ncbi:MAG: sigma-54-dependent Fis family transcriptional regulator [Ignavibacteriae bacterium]|nr:sigma-54-dependent Fis family transcriptional regulator [Ignavibacteriota bacterium]MCB9244214.1 sigma-54-dependent Fis family transcriptional regulator [Ignavibacteriales bacterium]
MDNSDIKILVVDDEVNFTVLLGKILEKKGFTPVVENNGFSAKEKIIDGDFDIIISDLQIPDVDGLELLKVKDPETLFIMITGYGSVDSAVESMKIGAYDYISKPFNIDEFTKKVDRAVEKVKLRYRLKHDYTETDRFDNTIIGVSKKMQKVYEMIDSVSKADTNVLIEGQSGTGKELVARAIHRRSSRRSGPFIAINCSAIPDALMESELFGHARGAFTGATERQKGVFELAHGGTLLLDEIAEMPFNLQSKLLRVIETWEIKPLGSDRIRRTDVRLISATNQNIKKLIEEKKFREDLYYRISTVTIKLPELKERKQDIPLLATHFLGEFSNETGRNFSITPSAVEVLVGYPWKGNVRELKNTLERAAIISNSEVLDEKNFKFLKTGTENEDEFNIDLNMELKDLEKNYIQKVLEENGWNKLQAANILGIDRKTLYNKIRLYNIKQ